jgi:hypothetical protein
MILQYDFIVDKRINFAINNRLKSVLLVFKGSRWAVTANAVKTSSFPFSTSSKI